MTKVENDANLLNAIRNVLAETMEGPAQGREHEMRRIAESERIAQAIFDDVISDLIVDRNQLRRERDLLAEAMTEAVVETGLIQADHGGLSGPQLLQFVGDLKEDHIRLAEQVERLQSSGTLRDRSVEPAF